MFNDAGLNLKSISLKIIFEAFFIGMFSVVDVGCNYFGCIIILTNPPTIPGLTSCQYESTSLISHYLSKLTKSMISNPIPKSQFQILILTPNSQAGSLHPHLTTKQNNLNNQTPKLKKPPPLSLST